MFSAIAPRYDLLNHLLSLNIDRAWRRQAVARLNWRARPDGLFLDACCGTYDLALELAGRPDFYGRVIAFDFSLAMLKEGRDKISRHEVTPLCADALNLPLAPQGFDGALIAFGLRNLVSIDAGLEEMRRVLRRGGGLVILDFSMPRRAPLRWLYRLYFTRLLPVIGRWISKHSHAYSYLPESVMGFPQPAMLARRMEDAGFNSVDWRPLTGGIACVWWGEA
jgi:demethylmenaquinone methyltransferase/2-methoxy-6-polyprenyl-1,4-benzoquinol methylase